jgi:hypothetical protein
MEIWSLTSASVFSDYMACILDSYDLIEEWKTIYSPEFWLKSMERYFNAHLTTPGPVEYVLHPKKKHLFHMVSAALQWETVDLTGLWQFISSSLYTTIDSQYICDILMWVNGMKNGSEKEKKLFSLFVSPAEQHLFYYLLGSDIEQVRILSLDYLLSIMNDRRKITPSRISFPRFKSDSETQLSLMLIIRRIQTESKADFRHIGRKLAERAFGNIDVDNWMCWGEKVDAEKLDYLLVLLELLPMCSISPDELMSFGSEISRHLSSDSFDNLWKAFEQYQSVVPAIFDSLDVGGHLMAVEIIGRILFCRLRMDRDAKSEYYLELDYFIISTAQQLIANKELAVSKINHLLEVLLSSINQYIHTAERIDFGLLFRRVFTCCHIFLFHFDSIFSILENPKAGYVHHNGIPFDSYFNLSHMFLDVCHRIMQLSFEIRLPLGLTTKTNAKSETFLHYVEELGWKVALSGLETKGCQKCLSYLYDFSQKLDIDTNTENIYQILCKLYEYIKGSYSSSGEPPGQNTELAISVFTLLWNKSQLWKRGDNQIKNPPHNDPKPNNFVEAFSNIYDKILLAESKNKEEKDIEKSKAEVLLMKERYENRIALEEKYRRDLDKQSDYWIGKGTIRKKQLTGLGQKVLFADLQIQKQESKAISDTGKKLFSAFNNSNISNYWKLDMYENKLRMRKRLTQNMEFNDHSDASTKRDKIPLVRTESIPLLKILKSHSDVFDEPRPSKLNRYHQFSSSMRTESCDSETSFDTDDWNVVPSDDFTVKNSMYQWDVELIYLMHSIRGKLFLSPGMVCFLPDEKPDAKSGPLLDTTSFECEMKQLGNAFF